MEYKVERGEKSQKVKEMVEGIEAQIERLKELERSISSRIGLVEQSNQHCNYQLKEKNLFYQARD